MLEKETNNPERMGLTIDELKKRLGIDKYHVVKPPVPIKKDGKHLYQVAGYFFPLKPETIERLKIPHQKILFEVNWEQWIKEMQEAKENQKAWEF